MRSKLTKPQDLTGSVGLASMIALVLAATVPSLGIAQPLTGYPERVEAYDPREVAPLPAYCKHAQLFRDRVPGGNDAAQIERWSRTLGPTFMHLHHYCWGLMWTNRALYLSSDKQVRVYYLQNSIGEFDYVAQRAPASFVLLPEILTKKGENLIRLNRGPLGVLELERAIELKADYWPPYAALSDYYRQAGNLAQARQVLNNGLANDPGAKQLRRRLAELDKEDKAKGRHTGPK
jgi:tetratricopeptide (TPR) repeat protein